MLLVAVVGLLLVILLGRLAGVRRLLRSMDCKKERLAIAVVNGSDKTQRMKAVTMGVVSGHHSDAARSRRADLGDSHG